MDKNPRLIYNPFTLAGKRIKNRIVHASIFNGMTREGNFSLKEHDYIVNRAKGGAGMIVTAPQGMSLFQDLPTHARVDSANLRAFENVARQTDAFGCRLLGQIQHNGRGSHYRGRVSASLAPSPLPDDLSWSMPVAMSILEIQAMIFEIARSCVLLKNCGFSGVEISAGHGHLFHQFLSPYSNIRVDRYGGDWDGRVRIVSELIDALRQECGSDFILGVKLPGDDGIEDSIGPTEAAIIADLLTSEQSIDYVCFANGAHGKSLDLHTPDRYGARLPYHELLKRLKLAVNNVPLMALGRVNDPAEAEGILERGEAQLIGLGRSLIADPAWPLKAEAGRTNEIRYCLSCNTCWDVVVTEHSSLACVNNPRVGLPKEVDWWPTPAKLKRRVVVVGGGIAGLEAAWVAAARGHRVTLFSISAHLGGKAWLRSHFPGGEEVSSIYDYQTVAAQRAGVDIEFGWKVDFNTILSRRPDAVVLATGSTMTPPNWIPVGIQQQQLIPDLRAAMLELLGTHARQPGTAVVYDMDHTDGTYACVQKLASLFEEVVIITPRDTIAWDMSIVARQSVFRRISTLKIRVIALSEPVWDQSFENGELSYRNIYSKEMATLKDVSFLAYATPRARNDELNKPLVAAGLDVHMVGDCLAPLEMLHATQSGHRIGNVI